MKNKIVKIVKIVLSLLIVLTTLSLTTIAVIVYKTYTRESIFNEYLEKGPESGYSFIFWGNYPEVKNLISTQDGIVMHAGSELYLLEEEGFSLYGTHTLPYYSEITPSNGGIYVCEWENHNRDTEDDYGTTLTTYTYPDGEKSSIQIHETLLVTECAETMTLIDNYSHNPGYRYHLIDKELVRVTDAEEIIGPRLNAQSEIITNDMEPIQLPKDNIYSEVIELTENEKYAVIDDHMGVWILDIEN